MGGKLRDLIMDPTHKGHTAAVIFALKCQFGWKETQGIDLSADLPELRFVLEKDES